MSCDTRQRVRPRLVGLSIIFQYRAPEFLALAAKLAAVLPGVHITTGGHFPSFAASELLRDHSALASVVRGEGELTLLELMQQLDAPGSWGDIRGLSFRQDGQVVTTPPRPLIADLDRLPFPERDTPPQHHLGIGYSPILGSRGCYRELRLLQHPHLLRRQPRPAAALPQRAQPGRRDGAAVPRLRRALLRVQRRRVVPARPGALGAASMRWRTSSLGEAWPRS